MLEMIHANGDCLRESWKNVLDMVVQLYRAQLLPTSITHVVDLDEPGCISIDPLYEQLVFSYTSRYFFNFIIGMKMIMDFSHGLVLLLTIQSVVY